ncbi:MAG: hypothetical protein JKY54_07085 [Flavobacteriales bacterium]|nr:hypothetical protein [Flavobacteriales bacterium]
MKIIKLLLTTFIFLFLASCGRNYDELLIGTWNEVDTGETIITYHLDHTYLFKYEDGRTESGVRRIVGSTLFTTEYGSNEEFNEGIETLTEKEMVVKYLDGMYQTSYQRAH